MVGIRYSGEDKMVDEVLLALAATGGTAVVTAAGTDTWGGLRQAVARWFGRDDAERERAALGRLDRTVTALQSAEPAELERARLRQEWQARFEMAFEALDGAEREQAAIRLREVLASHASPGGVTSGPGNLVVGGDARVQADRNSIAAAVINGGARIGPPSQPDPSQG
ncbi:hypothetical protein [Streptomyces sp. NPDC001508]|uniref:hypothetical protein n=1 Tax=Streptomyces sp. NPDC001508 TaxID=3154656 RepID=UPI00332BFD14